MKLQSPPLRTNPIKTGFLIKVSFISHCFSLFYPIFLFVQRGENFKNWKQRFFVIRNEDLNYQLEYFAGNDEKSGSLKGIIPLSGYYVYELTQLDITEHGEKGIKILPYGANNERKRKWFFKISDDNDRKEWLHCLQYACYKANPAADDDICIAKSFNLALQNLRYEYHLFDYFLYTGNEIHRLSELLYEIIDQEILLEYIDSLPENIDKLQCLTDIDKQLLPIIETAATTSWQSASSSIKKVSPTLQADVKNLLPQIIEKQKQLKTLLEEKALPMFDDFLESKVFSLLKPFLSFISPYIIDSFIKAIKLFHIYLNTDIIPKSSFSTVDLDVLAIDLYNSVNMFNGPFNDCYSTLWDLHIYQLPKMINYLKDGLKPYLLHIIIVDKLKTILFRAFHSFITLSKACNGTELSSVISTVTGMLFRDMEIMIKSTIAAVLSTVLSTSVSAGIVLNEEELLSDAQDALDNDPEAESLSVFINLRSLEFEVVEELSNKTIIKLIEDSSVSLDIKEKIEKVSSDIGVAFEGDERGKTIWRVSGGY
jgi:hypothetical protein